MACASRIGRGVCAEYRGAVGDVSAREARKCRVAVLGAQFTDERRQSRRSVSCGGRGDGVCGPATARFQEPVSAMLAVTGYALPSNSPLWPCHTILTPPKVGPSAWLGAQTSDTVEGYLKKGQTDLILIPIAFTSDHIETLYELDQEIIGESKQSGMKRAASLNGSPTFIKALADIASSHIDSGHACTKQLALRCPGCVNQKCLESKKFFLQQENLL